MPVLDVLTDKVGFAPPRGVDTETLGLLMLTAMELEGGTPLTCEGWIVVGSASRAACDMGGTPRSAEAPFMSTSSVTLPVTLELQSSGDSARGMFSVMRSCCICAYAAAARAL